MTEEGKFLLQKEFSSSDIKKFSNVLDEIRQLNKISEWAKKHKSLTKTVNISEKEKVLSIYSECTQYFLSEVLENHPNIAQELRNNLKNILFTLFTDFAMLAKNKIHHHQINPLNILVTDDYNLKVVNFIVPSSYNIYSDIQQIDNQAIIYNIKEFLEPEVLHFKTFGKSDDEFDPEKLDVYALAMCILNIIFFDNPQSLQNVKKYSIIIFQTDISESLKYILDYMIFTSHKQRPSFSECLEMLKYEDYQNFN